MVKLIKLIINTFKLLINRKSYVLMAVILPAIITVFFSFEFGVEPTFKVGVIDKDNSYVSQEIIDTIGSLEDVDVFTITENDYKIDLITQQIQMVVVIDEEFEENIINLKQDKLVIKSTSKSDVESVVESMINLKLDDLITISKLCDKDVEKFKELNTDYNDMPTQLSLNTVEENRPRIENSMGLIIMIIFIIGGSISNFLIEDKRNHTKTRITSSGISEAKYYISMISVFYLMSCATSVIYYMICKILNLDFGMSNSINFLKILLLLNLLAVAINIFIVSVTNSRYTSTILNILITVPSCMLSGVFWNFDMMPQNLQTIGDKIPIRWAYICINELQNNNDLILNEYIYSMLSVSTVIILCSILILKNSKKSKFNL